MSDGTPENISEMERSFASTLTSLGPRPVHRGPLPDEASFEASLSDLSDVDLEEMRRDLDEALAQPAGLSFDAGSRLHSVEMELSRRRLTVQHDRRKARYESQLRARHSPVTAFTDADLGEMVREGLHDVFKRDLDDAELGHIGAALQRQTKPKGANSA